MKTNISEFLPKQRSTQKLVQCRLPQELHAKMLAIFAEAKKEGVDASWQNFIEAACLAYVQEKQGTP